jgi:hypothetical protein
VDSKAVLNYVVAKLLGLVTLTSDRKTVSGTATDVDRKATQARAMACATAPGGSGWTTPRRHWPHITL